MRNRNGFEEFFCLRSYLRNDNIISARPGLKTGVENLNIFWSEIGSGFEEPGGTPPPRIPRSTLRYLIKMKMYSVRGLYTRKCLAPFQSG